MSEPTIREAIRRIIDEAQYQAIITHDRVKGMLPGDDYRPSREEATDSLLQLIAEREEEIVYKTRLNMLLKMKQAPPIDWLDAQKFIDDNLKRLEEQRTLLELGSQGGLETSGEAQNV